MHYIGAIAFASLESIIIMGPYFRLSKLIEVSLACVSGVDLALMAMCDVLIMSYGSYGDFGALLGRSKKQVLYPKLHKTHDESGVNLGGMPRFVPIPWKESA